MVMHDRGSAFAGLECEHLLDEMGRIETGQYRGPTNAITMCAMASGTG